MGFLATECVGWNQGNLTTKPVLTLYDSRKELVIAMETMSLLEDAFFNVKMMIMYIQWCMLGGKE